MKVIEYFHNKPQRGEVGIEIELEGRGIGRIEVPGWRGERDGSLRGDSVELVLPKPISRKTVLATVARIPKAIEAAGAEVIDTGRAGVHIHVNVQELTLTQVFNFVCAYMIFEDTLIDFCGEHRVGNLFCLRVRDADKLLQDIRKILLSGDYEMFEVNNIRYASMNLCAIPTYGSLEFRAMRSTIDPDLINNWAMMLLAIKDWSMTFDDPRDIVMAFSQEGPEQVFKSVFGELRGLLKFDPENLYEGVRNAQYVAFSLDDWNLSLYDKLSDLAQRDLVGFRYRGIVETLLENRDTVYRNTGYTKSIIRELEDFLERKEAGIGAAAPEKALGIKKPKMYFDPAVFQQAQVAFAPPRGRDPNMVVIDDFGGEGNPFGEDDDEDLDPDWEPEEDEDDL